MNLEALRQFSDTLKSSKNIEPRLDGFLQEALRHTQDAFSILKQALNNRGGQAAYRNILLGFLMTAEAPDIEKAAVAWQVALDSQEPISTRRSAAFLTTQLPEAPIQPDFQLRLLGDSDPQVVSFTLSGIRPNADSAVLQFIRERLIDSGDLHTRVAAIHAIGTAHDASDQALFRSVLAVGGTSNSDAFSPDSLPKRAAIPYLDMNDASSYSLVVALASDTNEDPGVRARAISRLRPDQHPEALPLLLDLLKRCPPSASVPLLALVDTLIIVPSSDAIAQIRTATSRIHDQQLQSLISQRLDNLATSH